MRYGRLLRRTLDGDKSSGRGVGSLLAIALVGLLLPRNAASQTATPTPTPLRPTFTPSPNPLASDFFTVTPCRLADTRNADGPHGGPALSGQQDRVFVVAGQCGIPDGVGAVSVNITVTQPTEAGSLLLFPAGTQAPLASTINYSAGQTRANNAVAVLGASGDVAISCNQPVGTTVQVIIDVNGYYPTYTPQVYEVTLVDFRLYCGLHGTRDIWNFSPNTYCPGPHPPEIRCGLIHIRVGDTVKWVWRSGTHSTTSGFSPFGDGKWDSGKQTGPFTFSHTFTQAGTYPYFCHPGHIGNPTIVDSCNVLIRHETGVVIVDP